MALSSPLRRDELAAPAALRVAAVAWRHGSRGTPLARHQPPRAHHHRHGRHRPLLARRAGRRPDRHDRHARLPPLLLQLRPPADRGVLRVQGRRPRACGRSPPACPTRGRRSSTTCRSTSPTSAPSSRCASACEAFGSEVTEVVDHQVMHSIYFNDPNGIALEASLVGRRRHGSCARLHRLLAVRRQGPGARGARADDVGRAGVGAEDHADGRAERRRHRRPRLTTSVGAFAIGRTTGGPVMKRVLGSVCVAVLALVAVGCGDDDDRPVDRGLPRAGQRHLRRGQRGARRRLRGGSSPISPPSRRPEEVAEVFTDSIVPTIQGELDDLRELTPPEDIADDIEELLDDADAALEEIEQTAEDDPEALFEPARTPSPTSTPGPRSSAWPSAVGTRRTAARSTRRPETARTRPGTSSRTLMTRTAPSRRRSTPSSRRASPTPTPTPARKRSTRSSSRSPSRSSPPACSRRRRPTPPNPSPRTSTCSSPPSATPPRATRPR